MDIEVMYQPTHSLARVALSPGETIEAEAGAMVGTTTNVEMTTAVGGMKKGLKRLFGGETLFRNKFSAVGSSGEVLLAPSLCGDMTVLDVSGGGWFLQSGAYVAGSDTVDLNTKVGGFKSFFAGPGFFILKATGEGQVLVGAFGALEEVPVNGELVVDTGHLVAWKADGGLSYTVEKAARTWWKSILSGEMLTCRFTGQGSVWIQTRNPSSYGRKVGLMLPPKKG